MITPLHVGIQNLPGSPLGLPVGLPNTLCSSNTRNSLPPPEIPGQNLKRAMTYLADYGGCGYYRCMGPNFLLNLYQKAVVMESTTMILHPKFYETVEVVKLQRQATPQQLQFVKYSKKFPTKNLSN